MLRSRLQEPRAEAEPLDQNAAEQQLQEKLTQHTNFYKKTLAEFLTFVNEHYPPPTAAPDTFEVNSSVGSSQSDVMSLKDMLALLMNKTVDSPNDPYVTLDPSAHWPPYVELLQRSGITVRHPNNDNLIKLTPFHI